MRDERERDHGAAHGVRLVAKHQILSRFAVPAECIEGGQSVLILLCVLRRKTAEARTVGRVRLEQGDPLRTVTVRKGLQKHRVDNRVDSGCGSNADARSSRRQHRHRWCMSPTRSRVRKRLEDALEPRKSARLAMDLGHEVAGERGHLPSLWLFSRSGKITHV